MRLALMGIPLSGVKTIYSAISGHAESGGGFRPSSALNRLSVLKVPDQRLDLLTEIFKPKKKVPATVELTEFPGLFGGEKTDPQAVAKARESDALVIVLRCFSSDVVPHPKDSIDPRRDLDDIDAEMVLSDLAVAENRLERLSGSVKTKANEDDLAEHAVLTQVHEQLEEGRPVRELDLKPEQRKRIRGFGFLTAKPRMLILNIGEGQLGEEDRIASPFREKGWVAEALCGSLEAELAQLEEEERGEFMSDFGVTELAAPRVLAAAYQALEVRTFYTYGDDECRAWTIKVGDNAVDAAAKIHTDLAKGFIRAEVIGWEDFERHRDIKEVKAAGRFRLEGKDYAVEEGDLIIIRHSG
ncbi:MAG TPA: DUF933 domain-containing protein [Acidobacteriota bacterium]|nr:DUF933 domain-containing protein [Acidobacteriota bacterium]